MTVFKRIRQYFCKHHYKKYYSKTEKTYITRCTKCGATSNRGEVE